MSWASLWSAITTSVCTPMDDPPRELWSWYPTLQHHNLPFGTAGALANFRREQDRVAGNDGIALPIPIDLARATDANHRTAFAGCAYAEGNATRLAFECEVSTA